MSDAESEDERPQVYTVRFSTQATQDLIEAAADLAERSEDAQAAINWLAGAYDEASKLVLFPQGHPVAILESRRFRTETRSVVYRRGRSKVADHLFYTIENADDGPLVTVLHVRHGSRAAITREEARRILQNP